MPARILPTLIKILLLCLAVGFVLSVLGFTPERMITNFWSTVRDIWRYVVDFAKWGWQYVALGAVIVIPLWLLSVVLGRLKR